jgi:septum formation protein
MKIILASTSPRRKEILSKTDLDFEIHPSDFEEDMTLDLEPVPLAKYLSLGKAQALVDEHPDALIISADTFITFENKKLGKPKTPNDAREMLTLLSGKPHSVITGFAIIHTGTNKIHSDTDESIVYFKNLDPQDIEEYVASGKPLDKAGSYGIQEIGHVFVDRIEGDYYNIMGLPLDKLIKVLNEEFNIKANKR